MNYLACRTEKKMPNDVLSEEANDAIREGENYFSSDNRDQRLWKSVVSKLKITEERLQAEIDKRSTAHVQELNLDKNRRLDEVREREKSKRIEDVVKNQQAAHQTFEDLRQVNGGAYPKNISPVL